MGRTACTAPQCLYSRAIPLLPLWAVRPVQNLSACTVELYLDPPMGRTACTEPQCLYCRAIPLLPLWPVRHIQSLSACTLVHFTVYFNIKSVITEATNIFGSLMHPFWNAVFTERDALSSYQHSAVHSKYTYITWHNTIDTYQLFLSGSRNAGNTILPSGRSICWHSISFMFHILLSIKQLIYFVRSKVSNRNVGTLFGVDG
jgi:hypothetical protein